MKKSVQSLNFAQLHNGWTEKLLPKVLSKVQRVDRSHYDDNQLLLDLTIQSNFDFLFQRNAYIRKLETGFMS